MISDLITLSLSELKEDMFFGKDGECSHRYLEIKGKAASGQLDTKTSGSEDRLRVISV